MRRTHVCFPRCLCRCGVPVVGRRIMFDLVVLGLWFIVSSHPQGDTQVPSLCEPMANLPLELGITANKISLQHGTFYSGQDSETYAKIHFTNRFSQNIRVITLVVDYTGQGNGKLATIAFRSMPKGV